MKADQSLWVKQRALDFYNGLRVYDAFPEEKQEMIKAMIQNVRDLWHEFYPRQEERKVGRTT